MKKTLITLLLVQMGFAPAFAKPGAVIVRSIDSTDFELQQFLDVYQDHKSLAEYQMEQRQNSPERKELLRRFEQAQRDFLSSSFSKSKISYLKVIDMVRQATWLPRDRELIYSSYLRLAQVTPAQSEHWLEEAARFAVDLSPNENNFAPPLIQQAYLMRTKVMNQIELWQPQFWESAAAVIVDGRLFKSDLKGSIPLTPGPHRIDVLSNLSAPDTRILDRREILEYIYSPRILVGGNCEKPAINSNPLTNPSQLALFYSIGCVKQGSEKGWTGLLGKTRYDFKPQLETKTDSIALNTDFESKSNRWLWMSLVGAALAVVLINEKNKQGSQSVTATHETGIKE
jgi:hypothetical protein